MLNLIWLGLIVSAVLMGGFAGRVPAVGQGAIEGAEAAVTLAFGLVGIMALWLGLMRLAERAGLVRGLAWLLQPLLRRLFPDVPAGHPALGSMVMNLAANMLGLANAATPLGLRAMRDLELLNPHPGTATNAMCTFLAVNTSSVQLIPVTAVAILATAGSAQPSAIIGTALLATTCSTAAGIIAVKTLQRWRPFRTPVTAAASPGIPPEDAPLESTPAPVLSPATLEPLPIWGKAVLAAFAGCCLWFTWILTQQPLEPGMYRWPVRLIQAISLLAIPCLVAFFPLYAALRRVPVYEEFVEGAKEGFHVGVRIIPYLVAMLVAIGMFRGAGAIDRLSEILGPILRQVGLPPELLPLAVMRPLSGSGSLALLADLARQFGGDHLISRMAGTLVGGTETTFYVAAVYFGAVNVRRTRHAIPAGLIADATGVAASVVICRLVFG